MNFYEKMGLWNNTTSNSSDNRKDGKQVGQTGTSIAYEAAGTGSKGTLSELDISKLNVTMDLFASPDTLFLNEKPKYKNSFGLEADDDPFGSFDGSPNEGDSMEVDPGAPDDDDPFGQFGNVSAEGDDPFGSFDGTDGGGEGNPEGEEEQKDKGETIVDRKEVISDSTNLSNAIRRYIPPNFVRLTEVIRENTRYLDNLNNLDETTQTAVNLIAKEYRRKLEFLNDYLALISERTFDEIWSAYLIVFRDLRKLREAYKIALNLKDENHNIEDLTVSQLKENIDVISSSDHQVTQTEEIE